MAILQQVVTSDNILDPFRECHVTTSNKGYVHWIVRGRKSQRMDCHRETRGCSQDEISHQSS